MHCGDRSPAIESLEPVQQAGLFLGVVFRNVALAEFVGRSVGLVGGSARP